MHRYIGITIGPIFDTIMDASSPAALWFASSLFSDTTRRVCIEIKKAFSDAIIYSPYFNENIRVDDGIGKFHDRVVFSTECYDSGKMQECVLKVKRETATCFPERFVDANTIRFLEQYIQIHFVELGEDELEGRNCILALSPYLDTLELMRWFPADNLNNVVRKLFCGEETGRNLYIKQSPLFKRIKVDNNQLKKSTDGLWTIEEIACDHEKIGEPLKRKDYYVVVQADGDNMGKFLETLDRQAVTAFSKACLDYDEAVCEKIGAYGGMTIYAGGDDLLFLAPVMNANGEDIFELCAKIGKLFHDQIVAVDMFKDSPYVPTISFGIAIQHKKFPLYEAFARGRGLLSLAKENSTQKDNMAVEVLKHSGKSIKVIVPNKEYDVLREVIQLRGENEKIVHSVIYTLQKFQKLLSVLDSKMKIREIDEKAYQYAFMNLFDHMEQSHMKNYLKKIGDIYQKYFVIGDTQICVPEKNKRNNLETYIRLLLIQKFLVEKEGSEY